VSQDCSVWAAEGIGGARVAGLGVRDMHMRGRAVDRARV
jgi:hypothetical protein